MAGFLGFLDGTVIAQARACSSATIAAITVYQTEGTRHAV